MPLKTMQEQFVEAVRSQRASPELVATIEPGGTLTNEEALLVYSLDYHARMQEALSKNYEATWLLLGDEAFFQYARDYILSYPSDLSNLTTYGDNFPDLLKKSEADIVVQQMATFERKFWIFFHCARNPSIELSKEILELSKFDLSGIHLFESEIRLDLIWQKREVGSEGLAEIEIYEKFYLALFKAEEKVEVMPLFPSAYKILFELMEVGRISEISPEEYAPNIWAQVLSILMFSRILNN